MRLGHLGVFLGVVVAMVATALAFLLPNLIYDHPFAFSLVAVTVCVVAYFAGFTSRTTMEDAVEPAQSAQHEYSSSVSAVREYIHTVTAPCILVNSARRIIDANSALESLWGASLSRLVDGHIAFSDTSSDRDIWTANLDEVPIGTSAHRVGDILLRGEPKSSGAFQLTWTAYPSTSERSILIEIADSKANKQSPENQNIEMVAGFKILDDDRSLLSELNHGLRTELQALLGLIELSKGATTLEQQQRHLGTLEYSTRRVISTVDTLSNFFAVGASANQENTQSYSLDQLLSGISKKLNQRSDTDTFEVLYDTDHSVSRVISFPRDLLEKLICHLVYHIIRFRSDSSIVVKPRIDISSDLHPVLNIEVSLRDRRNQAADRAAIYDSEEVSLDLEIARRLAGSANGTLITGEFSAGDVGFKFTTDQIKVDERGSGIVVPNYLKNLRALIIDDNPVSREVLQELAHTIGWNVDVAASGEAALHLMKLNAGMSNSYDVVLVDWRMPDVDGWETSKRIRAEINGGALPIIVMISAHNHDYLSKDSAERAEILNGFITKPISLSMLLDAVIDATSHHYTPEAPHAGTKPLDDDVVGLSGKKVLVVDDNAINLEVAREILTRYGANVTTASGGYAAIAGVQSSGKMLDLVLMDVQMPDLDGIGAASKIRALGYLSLPIILMTANTSETLRRDCFRAGAMDVVQKPFLARDLIETVLLNLRSHKKSRKKLAVTKLSQRTIELASELGVSAEVALESLDGNLESYSHVLDSFLLEAARVRDHFYKQAERQNTDDLIRELNLVAGMLNLVGDKKTVDQARKLAARASEAARLQEAIVFNKEVAEFGQRFDEAVKTIQLLQSYLLSDLGYKAHQP